MRGDELSVTRAVARIRPNAAIVHDCDRAADGRAFLVLESLDKTSESRDFMSGVGMQRMAASCSAKAATSGTTVHGIA